jgi:hypothetical protein
MSRLTSLSMALVVGGIGLSTTGCQFFEKKVPENIVSEVVGKVMKFNAPGIASAMCGGSTRGFTSVTVTIKSRGEKNHGVVHVKGKPWMSADEELPSTCEGDMEYAFSFKTRTYGIGKRRRTETTWTLESLKLTAVQTKGVKFKEVDEKMDDNMDPDEEKGGDDKADKGDKGDKKKKKGGDDD